MLKPRTIYHLVQAPLWEAVKASGKDYVPPTFYQDGGMIHATDAPEILLEVGNLFYSDVKDDFLLLDIDVLSPSLQAEVKFEPPAAVGDKPVEEGEHLFPHIYGPLPMAAVTRERTVQRSADGKFLGIDGATTTEAYDGPMVFDVADVGPRELVDEARAAELLAPLLSSTRPIAGIRLSNKSYTIDAAQAIARALEQVSAAGRLTGSLVDVDIADIIAGRPEDEALAVLRTVCEPLAPFKELLSIDVSDNAFGEKGLTACEALLVGQTRIQSLKACNNGISAAAAAQLCGLILDTTGDATLERFHFHNNMSGAGGARAIATMLVDPKLRRLRDLRFSGTRAGREGTLAVAQALASQESSKDLARLDLSDNAFLDEGSDALAKALCRYSQLRVLLLRDSSLEAGGTKAVSEAIASVRPALEELDLSGNEIGSEEDDLPEAAAALRLALAVCAPSLKVFLCEDNELKSKGLAKLSAALAQCVHLRRLQLCGNEITGKGAVRLVELLVSVHTSTPTQLLQSTRGLELDGNFIEEDMVERLQELLAGAGGAKALGSLEDNDPDQAEDEDEDEDEEEEDAAPSTVDEELQALTEQLSQLGLATPGAPAASSAGSAADELKQAAGFKAVDDYVKSGMVVGLGTGSTAEFAVDRVAEKLKSGALVNILGIPTSERTRDQAMRLGIPLTSLDELQANQLVDVAIDGADAVDPKKNLVKGGGGALLREKMVEASAKQFIVIVDASKPCPALGPSFPIPVEVTPFCHRHTGRLLAQLPSVQAAHGTSVLRLGSAANNKQDGEHPAVTDNGNYIYDIHCEASVQSPETMALELSSVVGVVEHGLFVGMASAVLTASPGGVLVQE